MYSFVSFLIPLFKLSKDSHYRIKLVAITGSFCGNTMPAFFSGTDNEDETITGLYGVIGCLDSKPQIRFRAAMGGSFGSIPIKKLFYEKEGDRTEMYGN